MNDEPKKNKLGTFLQEVSNWRWNDFWKAERDKTFSSNQAMIFALIRSCAMQNLNAIKLATNRLDGKLATPVQIEFPKVFYLYPNAIDPSTVVTPDGEPTAEVGEIIMPEHPTKALAVALKTEPTEEDLPSLSIRQTVAHMADYPRELPEAIIASALATEGALNSNAAMPEGIPMVKSVIAAHLLTMAQNRDIQAISEVFDNIDGKLTETIKLLGEDLYITSYALTAPEGATKNADGIYQIEAPRSQDMWANKLAKEGRR